MALSCLDACYLTTKRILPQTLYAGNQACAIAYRETDKNIRGYYGRRQEKTPPIFFRKFVCTVSLLTL